MKQRDEVIGDSDEILTAYQTKKYSYERLVRQINEMEQYLESFDESIKLRSRAYICHRKVISKRVAHAFESYLQMLNFSGQLTVYHTGKEDPTQVKPERTLEIRVNPKSGDLVNAYSDSRSLSGGERSFSTIALLLSLWDYCTSPFNILDEIDVFMDMITRHLALDALIESASRRDNRQYIFLSPLPPEKKSISELLKIVYMPEPERGTN